MPQMPQTAGMLQAAEMVVSPIARPLGYEPGLPFLGTGIERYPVRAGGATLMGLEAGDRLEIIDPEGRQPCELLVFDGSGRADAGALGVQSTGPAGGLAAMMTADSEDARALAYGLRRRGLDPAGASAVHLFDKDSGPGESASFTAERAVTCIVAAPGEAMEPDQQTPPTDLVALVHRSRLERAEVDQSAVG